MMSFKKNLLIPLTTIGVATALVSCGGTTTSSPSSTPSTQKTTPSSQPTSEVEGRQPRLAVTYDGGVLILDATKLNVISDIPASGFTRLGDAGDGRRLLLTENNAFRLLDLGSWTRPHGDHTHSYTTSPMLTDVTFTGETPGHAVAHDETVTLFFDGSGEYKVYDARQLTNTTAPETKSYKAEHPHHGAALILPDGTRLETLGTKESRVGARALDSTDKEIARAENCPGVHGEATAADHHVVFGCQDGVLIFDGKKFSKATSPDSYGRVATQIGTEESPIVLGDYKTSKEAKDKTTKVSLTDTKNNKITIVDLSSGYTFRSLARGPKGEALVLNTDGKLRVIDPATAKVTQEISVVGAWTEPEKWQQPRPTLRVLGDRAYVSEPTTSSIHVVDLTSMKVINTGKLPKVPNEVHGNLG